MRMKSTYTAYISPSRMEKCDALIEDGVFDNMSNLVESSLRHFFLSIKLDGYRPSYIWRESPYVRISLKLNEWLVDSILEMQVVSKPDLFDYSLEHMFDTLKRAGVMKEDAPSHPADRPGAGVGEVEESSGPDVRDGRRSVCEGDGHAAAERRERNDVGQVARDPIHRYASHRDRCGHIISFILIIYLDCYRRLRIGRHPPMEEERTRDSVIMSRGISDDDGNGFGRSGGIRLFGGG